MKRAPDIRREYFDAIAPRWEGIVNADRIRERLSPLIDRLHLGADEHILDLGCGTGILTRLLLQRLSERGRVSAVDFSGAMLDLAREHAPDLRVSWIASDASSLPLQDGCVHRAIAFSTWPHFPDPRAVTAELRRVIRPGGSVHIIHIDSRAVINAIHTNAGGAIGGDHLPPARDLAADLTRFGFSPTEVADAGERYIVSAIRDIAP